MTDFKRILILLENPSGTEREFLNGISRYARRSNKKWHLINTPPNDLNVFKTLSSWNAQGAIGVASTLKMAESAKKLSFPFVNLSTRRILKNSIQIGPDHRALGQVAAEYLTNLGFRNLAFITSSDPSASDLRLEGFKEILSEQNLPLHTVHVSDRPMEDTALLELIKTIPKPAAFCGSTDALARGILRACRELDVSTPEQIAILGIGNNTLLCESGFIPLSSVSWPAEQVGYEAARLLNELLNGARPPRQPLLLPPTEVIVRQSTDILAVTDKVVARALRMIREKAKERIRIKDIVKGSGVSRRSLEVRFRQVMHRGLHEEIRRVQLELAKKILRETDWVMDRVAEESGFGGGIHMSLEFKKNTGTSPSAYRKQFDADRTRMNLQLVHLQCGIFINRHVAF